VLKIACDARSMNPSKPPHLPGLVAVSAWTAAYDYYHDRYQAYYKTGLHQALAESGVRLVARPLHRFPRVLRSLRRARSSPRLATIMGRGLGPAIDSLAAAIAGRRTARSGEFHPLAGQYEFTLAGGRTLRLVVDVQDAGEVASESLLGKCDVYAKSNYRLDCRYPDRVVPVCNGNPITLPYLSSLRALRDRPPEYDICFIVRVWGGRDEEAGVEHNLRLLEAVNKARCTKRLLAYLVTGDLDRQEERLRAQGIPTTRVLMAPLELWTASASARTNVIRLGMHNCIPWRFLDLLAMGACVVFDQAPQTVWAPQLVSGEHYLDLGVPTTPDLPLAPDANYEAIPDRIESFVRDRERASQLRARAAQYFDRHACPLAVGRQLLAHLTRAMGAL
jgi:hypothetical protein